MKNRKLVFISGLVLAALLTVSCQPDKPGTTTSVSTDPTSNSTTPTSVVGDDATINVLSQSVANPISLPQGVTLANEYKITYNTDPQTIDYLATFRATDSDVTTNLIDTLVSHDEFGVLRAALASKVYRNSTFDVYKFEIRRGVKWVTSTGEVYPQELTAHDFVTGMQHLLDSQGGGEEIVSGLIKNATEYMDGEVPFSQVGVKAVDDYTLVYTLEEPTTYFMTMLVYNIFQPMNKDFYLSKGCKLGVTEYAESKANCTFGLYPNIDSILYNGPYVLSAMVSESKIEFVKNTNYWDKDKVFTPTVKWIFDKGDQPQNTYDTFKTGGYSALGISNTVLESAKTDFPNNLYNVDTNAVSYFAAWNLDRKAYSSGTTADSPKTAQQKIDTKKAILNKNFRKAVFAAWDRPTWNAITVGAELKLNRIRNTYTPPTFTSLPETFGGHAAGTDFSAMVGAEVSKLDTYYNGKSFADATDPYLDLTRAKELWEQAKLELITNVAKAEDRITLPVTIDIVYITTSVNNTNQGLAFKTMIESAFTKDGVKEIVVNAIGASQKDYYSSTYYAYNGADANYDLFWGSGWGPDYGDPLTYLNTLKYGGDMNHVIGIDGLVGQKAIYEKVLPNFMNNFNAALKSPSVAERFVNFAKAEAELIGSGLILPWGTQGGNWAISSAIPRTVSYSLYGIDNRSYKGIKVATAPLTKAQRDAYISQWSTERARLLAIS